MEDGLREVQFVNCTPHDLSLNPCFNGRWSARSKNIREVIMGKSLNPCFNGRWSASPG